ncbi:hypothetical protein EYC80_000530 [Monilinia laxa]|nr:hypothetical protein EYC80_000530 [Monilinia laxa]
MGTLCTNPRFTGVQEEEEDGRRCGNLPDGTVSKGLRYSNNIIPLMPDDNDEEAIENDALAARETVEREIEEHRRRAAYTKSVFHHAQTDRDTL